jgi:cobalt/nickel transport system permease protein
MRHEALDAFARDSRFVSVDPRIKLLSVVWVIVVLSFLTGIRTLEAMLGLAFLLLLISRVPATHILRHFLLTLPFIGMASLSLALTSGQDAAVLLFMRSSASVLLLLFVGSTTPFFDLLRGLQQLRIPQTYIVLLFFLYRYIFVIWNELDRMDRARMARGFVKQGSLRDGRMVRGITGTAGMVLVRSYERGKRSYRGLLARGYTGEIRTLDTLTIGLRDVGFLVVLVGWSVGLLKVETGIGWPGTGVMW